MGRALRWSSGLVDVIAESAAVVGTAVPRVPGARSPACLLTAVPAAATSATTEVLGAHVHG
ncbi:hypothetical protein [Geodermatophilus sp. SYSU D01105]